jgi:hypothetical protein
MLGGALLTIIALTALFWKFGETFRQAILGYDIVTDVVVTGLFVWLFASTGTISGMMIAIMSGLIVSIMLLIGKKLGTSRTLVLKRVKGLSFEHHWVVHHGLYSKFMNTKAHA